MFRSALRTASSPFDALSAPLTASLPTLARFALSSRNGSSSAMLSIRLK